MDLFTHCTAEQVLRLAGISREMQFSAENVIYRRNSAADAFFCVIDGRVVLDDGAGGRREIGAHSRFGVLEILSGRLRTTDAIALEDSRVLAIEAEDLFDLLSANIEIVKALFRRLAGAEEGRSLS